MTEKSGMNAEDHPAPGSEISFNKNYFANGPYIIGFTVLIAVFFVLIIPSFLPVKRGTPIDKAKLTLRSFGSAQLAYFRAYGNNYASFDALKSVGMVQDQYTPGKMIQDYSMYFRAYNLSTCLGEDSIFHELHTFTIIAYPAIDGDLKTYGITEDQFVREFAEGNDPDSVKSWEPIL
ncbi:MAG TPA: hypothetical protein VGB30_10940 [bacterium]